MYQVGDRSLGKKPNKLLIIGIDGGDPELIFRRFRNQLPNISKLKSEGRSGVSLSTIPSATIPAWNSFFTGVNPGAHGLFDFTTPPDYHYRINFINSSNRNVPAFWKTASGAGKKCAVLNFPSCYPPEAMNNGIMISGFDCPLPSGADRSFVYPAGLYDRIIRKFGQYRISGFDQVELRSDNMQQAAESLYKTVEYKGNVAQWLLEQENWDLFMIHFGEVDAACHHFWRYFDNNSPRRTGEEPGSLADVIPEVYSRVDRQVGELVAQIDDNWAVMLMSDHGFRGTGRNVLHLNNLLASAGLLKYRRRNLFDDSNVKRILKYIPLPLQKYFFRGKLAEITDRVEGMRRIGNIDMSKTYAFSEELNYFPSIRLNLKGRFLQGTVSYHDTLKVLKDAIAAVESSLDPHGKRVVKSIYRAEEIYSGRFTREAPDLILELNTPDGYLNGLLPSEPGGAAVRELVPDEYPGGKGSFPNGGHRRKGFYVIRNYSEYDFSEDEVEIIDLTRFVHYILDLL
ncbi:MAG: hypothetical protein GF315_00715 [candidate division Zixibacteria bacterium]|nr:hypothetical protein [candidate division Zixibacteria bacterium]